MHVSQPHSLKISMSLTLNSLSQELSLSLCSNSHHRRLHSHSSLFFFTATVPPHQCCDAVRSSLSLSLFVAPAARLTVPSPPLAAPLCCIVSLSLSLSLSSAGSFSLPSTTTLRHRTAPPPLRRALLPPPYRPSARRCSSAPTAALFSSLSRATPLSLPRFAVFFPNHHARDSQPSSLNQICRTAPPPLLPRRHASASPLHLSSSPAASLFPLFSTPLTTANAARCRRLEPSPTPIAVALPSSFSSRLHVHSDRPFQKLMRKIIIFVRNRNIYISTPVLKQPFYSLVFYDLIFIHIHY